MESAASEQRNTVARGPGDIATIEDAGFGGRSRAAWRELRADVAGEV